MARQPELECGGHRDGRAGHAQETVLAADSPVIGVTSLKPAATGGSASNESVAVRP